MPSPNESQSALQDHGGNLREVKKRFGLATIVDFSASINPLGTPDGLRDYVMESWGEVLTYPDRTCEAFRSAVAVHWGIPFDTVVAGNGSAELIDLLLRELKPCRLVLCPPDFGLYEKLAPEGTPIVRLPRMESRGFAPDVSQLTDILRPGDVTVFSNPGNPSGCALSPEDLIPLLEQASRAGAQVVLDEAFADFCPGSSTLGRLDGTPTLTVLRSLTKFYGIPGLRLGFLVSDPDLVRRVAHQQVPWSVNALAQAAGVYCLAQSDWEARTLSYVESARHHLSAGLQNLPGLLPLPSAANYLLVKVRSPAPTARDIYEGAARHGVLIRHCASFGLGERYFRVAVRTREQNALLVRILRDVVSPREVVETVVTG